MSGLKALFDELKHLLARDAVVADARLDLDRRQRGVGDAIRHVEGADRVRGVVEELDLDAAAERLAFGGGIAHAAILSDGYAGRKRYSGAKAAPCNRATPIAARAKNGA